MLAAGKSLRSPGLDVLVTAYTDVGGTIGMPILAVTAAVVLSVRRRSWTPAILIVAAGAGSLLMTIAGKRLIGRTRPDLTDAVPPYEYSASFPSGHSLNSIVIAGIVAYLVILRLKTTRARILTAAAAAFFALSMGLSRVYLGHHWLTDVLAAWTLGAAWLTLIITAHRLYLTVRKQRAVVANPIPS
jgi:undecaprenyl-diphosphatase